MYWPGTAGVRLLHTNPSIPVLLHWVQDGHQTVDVFLVSSSYQSQIAGNCNNILAYHSKGPGCCGLNQTIKRRAAEHKKLL